MQIQKLIETRRTYVISLTEDEVDQITHDMAEFGSPHDPICHSFCNVTSCGICKLVKGIRLVRAQVP